VCWGEFWPVNAQSGMAAHVYLATASMHNDYFHNAR
jgi:hypothetical protein